MNTDPTLPTAALVLPARVEPPPLVSAQQIIALCVALLAILALGFTAWAAREFLIPIAVAILLAVMLSPVARAIENRGAPPVLSSAIITIALVAAIAALIYTLIPELAALSEQLPRSMQAMQEKLEALRTGVLAQIERASTEIQEATEDVGVRPDVAPVAVQQSTPLGLAMSTIARILAQGAAALLLVFFLLSQRRRMKCIVVAIARNYSTKKRLITMFADIKTRVATYLLSIAATSAGLGACTALAFYFLGFPNAIVWGVAAGVLNLVPFAGPIAVQIAALIAGVLTYPDLVHAVAPAAILWIFNLIESQFVTPWFVARKVVLNPLSVCLAIIFGGWLWGVVGAVVAVPALIVAASVVQHWWAPCSTNGPRGPTQTAAPSWAFDGRLSHASHRRGARGAASVDAGGVSPLRIETPQNEKV